MGDRVRGPVFLVSETAHRVVDRGWETQPRGCHRLRLGFPGMFRSAGAERGRELPNWYERAADANR